MPDAKSGDLNGIFQCFERSHLDYFMRCFCLVGHRLLRERVNAFVLARGRLLDYIQFYQAWDEDFARSPFSELLRNHRVDRIER
jgi:hypothetical protein